MRFFLFLPLSSFSFVFLFMHIRYEIRMRRNYVKLDDWHIFIKKTFYHLLLLCMCGTVGEITMCQLVALCLLSKWDFFFVENKNPTTNSGTQREKRTYKNRQKDAYQNRNLTPQGIRLYIFEFSATCSVW